MKRIISFIIAMLMIFSCAPVFCAQSLILCAKNAEKSTEAIASGLGKGSLILGGGEWIKFNLANMDLSEGNYTVSLRQSNVLAASVNKKDIVFADILVDGELRLKKELVPTTSNTDFAKTVLGNVYIDRNSKWLTVRNSSDHLLAEADIESVELELSDEDAYVCAAFSGMDVLSFEDKAGADFWSNSVTPMGVSCGSVMLHGTGDNASYDISGLPSGLYEIIISSAERFQPGISLIIDGKTRIDKVSVNVSGAYGVYTDTNFGKFYISDTAEILTVKNSAQATEIRTIILKKISDGVTIPTEDYDDFYSNQNASPEINNGGVALKNGEKITFNLDNYGISSGNYRLHIKYKNEVVGKANAFLDVLSADELVYKDELKASASVFETDLSTVYLCGTTLALKNSACHKDSRTDVYSITLTPVYEHSVQKLVYNAFNIIADTQGVGFTDAAGADFWETKAGENGNIASVTTAAKSAVLHPGDSVTYDISGLSEGMYSLKILSSERYLPILEISADGKIYKEAVSLNISGGYGAQSETYTDVGNIFIDGNRETLTIKNIGNATYLRSFTLEKLSDEVLQSEVFELDVLNAYSKTEGEGFHDENGNDFDSFGFTPSDCVRLGKGDWIKYDASTVPCGNYSVYASVQSDGARLTANGEVVALADNSDEFERNLTEIKLCEFVLSENNRLITLENTSEEDKNALIRKLILKRETAESEFGYYDSEEASFPINKIIGSEELYLKGKIGRFNSKTENVSVTSAFYRNGKLIDLVMFEQNAGEEFNKRISSAIYKNADCVKTFVWNSSAKPYGKEKVLYSGRQTHIYVSGSGDDASGDGSEKKPFKTIKRAQEKVRELNKNMVGDIIVNLSGEFYISEPVVMTNEDSGSNGFSVIYRGDGTTAVYGGRKVCNFEKLDGTSLYRADVENVEDFRQLYVNGNRAVRAKSEYLYTPEAEFNDGVDNYKNNTIDGFVVAKEDFDGEFSKPYNMEFVWQPSWKNIRMPVEDITKNDDGDYIFTFRQPYFDMTLLSEGDGMPKPSKDIPFYIENAREFLDQEGEWFFDKEKNVLYYYPLKTENMETAECFIPVSSQLLVINGENAEKKAENITFENIKFSYGGWEEPSEKGFITHQAESLICVDENGNYTSKMIPAQIELKYTDNVKLISNEISHLGSVGISVSQQSDNAVVSGNIFDDISASAVILGDEGLPVNAPKSELCSNILVSENLVRRTAVEYMTPIITAYHLRDSQIKHNDIKDAPYTGISVGWGWGNNVNNSGYNDISSNKIENVMYRLLDGGHIYTLGKQTGTVINGNYLIKSEDYHGGIYLDNSSSEITVINNVFEKCPKWIRMLWHNVKNNTGKNNYSLREGSILNANEDQTVRNNDFDEAISYDEQNAEVLKIKENAGLSDSFSYLLEKYEAMGENYRNDALKWLKYDTSSGIVIPAGDYMEGGEGVAYHDISEVSGGLSSPFEPGLVAVGSGINHKYITMTGQGEWTKYQVEIPVTAEYEFYMTFASLGYQYVNIYIDDNLIAKRVRLNKTADNYNDVLNTLTEQKFFEIPLDEGLHTVKIEHAISNFVPYKFRLNKKGDVWEGRKDGFKEEILNDIK